MFTRRYPFLDQQIGVILTEAGPIVVDTRTTSRQAREIIGDLRAITSSPAAAVINTHHHFDHAFGNSAFRPAPIWAHVRCAERLRDFGAEDRTTTAGLYPRLRADLERTDIELPDRTFEREVTLSVGGRTVDLRFEGRGHTDNDAIVIVPDAAVVFAGDLVVEGGPPFFGDAFPLEWPETLIAVRRHVGQGALVPGHGAIGALSLVDRAIDELALSARLCRRVAEGLLSLDDAVRSAPFDPDTARDAIERGVAHARDMDGSKRGGS